MKNISCFPEKTKMIIKWYNILPITNYHRDMIKEYLYGNTQERKNQLLHEIKMYRVNYIFKFIRGRYEEEEFNPSNFKCEIDFLTLGGTLYKL